MRQTEQEFQFFKPNKKVDKSTDSSLLVPLLAFVVNLILTFSIISYFNSSGSIDKNVQIKIIHLNNSSEKQSYGVNYEKIYDHIKHSEVSHVSKDSIASLEPLNNKNIYSVTFTPEEINQINQYFNSKK